MYSQSLEEQYILEALPTTGTLLDIGAHNGEMFSNTLALIEHGWGGVLVEPGLQAFLGLLERHGNNPKLRLVHSLIGSVNSLVSFWNSADGLSTTDENHHKRWEQTGGYSPIFHMPQITIMDLIQSFPMTLENIDMVNIDIEGYSAALFLTFPILLYRPKLFCVEHDGIAKTLLAHGVYAGYQCIYQNNENVILVRNDQ